MTTDDLVVDARGLPPPRPMELILDALDRAGECKAIRLLIDREPVPLYDVLRRNGYMWATSTADDGSYEIRISSRLAA